MSGTSPQQPIASRDKPARDWWDKAEIISKFVSSVVLALVGILISYSIQRAQLISSQRTNEAQIVIATTKAQNDMRLQEAQLASQLVEHLASQNEAQREIAIVALRSSIPAETFDRIVAIVARGESDAGLRNLAIRQLGWSSGTIAATTLSQIVNDTDRPNAERAQAERSALQIAAIKTVARTSETQGTILLASTGVEGRAIDAERTGYSPFAESIVKGLQGSADENEDGTISGSELAHYVATAVPIATPWQQPIWVRRGRADVRLGPPATVGRTYPGMRAILVGVSSTPSASHRLVGPNNDVRAIAALFRSAGIDTLIMLNDEASKSTVLSAFAAVANASAPEDLFIFYFSGFAKASPTEDVHWLLSSGEQFSASEIKTMIDGIPADSKAIFINSSYAGAITR
ncbi:MAG TPA: caspase family protein [Thermoanaerobaculia bacterium]|nr:caspase family protein [Thermoanaerobaculia bacterium]